LRTRDALLTKAWRVDSEGLLTNQPLYRLS